MHSFTILLCSFLTAFATAQSTADLPPCSLECFSKARAVTPCAANDLICQCQPSNAGAIKDSVTACLPTSSCSIADLQHIQTWSQTFCPNILSSASAKTSPSPTASHDNDVVVTVTASNPSTPSAPSTTASSSSAASLGAGTPGTKWSTIPQSRADRGPLLSAISIILLSIAGMLVLLRFFARAYTQHERQAIRGIWWDEWFALLGLVLTAGVTADIVVGTRYSIGRHLAADISGADLISIMKIIYAFVVVVMAALGAVKFSVLCLYLRMTPDWGHRVVIWVFMGVVVARYLVAQIISIVPCLPISEYWSLTTPLLRNPHCIHILAFSNFNNAWSVLEDILIWALPIPTIYSLAIPRSRKIPLYVLFAVSGVSVVCSVLRMALFVTWVQSSDVSWNYPLVPFFSNVEACVALGAGSAPALLPLWRSLSGSKETRRQAANVAGAGAAPPEAGPPGASGNGGSDPEKGSTNTNSPPQTFNSQSSTAVPPSTSAPSSRRLSKSFSLWSFKWRPLSTSTGRASKHVSWNFMGVNTEGNVTTLKSEDAGTRTELKEIDGDYEEERGLGAGIVPGLMPGKQGIEGEENRKSWRGSLRTVVEEREVRSE